MHGVKRTHLSAQLKEQKRQLDLGKITTYRQLNATLLAAKAARTYTLEAFGQTTLILSLNPEYYTAWNYRREILNHLMETDAALDFLVMFGLELTFTLALLKRFPKCYWLWNHRVWVLQQYPKIPLAAVTPTVIRTVWETELAIVSRLLEADSRNFHGWHYRRYVTSQPALSGATPSALDSSEFAYTTQKINANLSNYSAWHQRSKLVPRLFDTLFTSPQVFLDEELTYLTTAMYTDATDSAHWEYLHWLLCGLLPTVAETTQRLATLERVLLVVEELNALEVEDEGRECKWCLVCMSWIARERMAIQPSPEVAEELQGLAARLTAVDPLRKGRWADLAGEVGTSSPREDGFIVDRL